MEKQTLFLVWTASDERGLMTNVVGVYTDKNEATRASKGCSAWGQTARSSR